MTGNNKRIEGEYPFYPIKPPDHWDNEIYLKSSKRTFAEFPNEETNQIDHVAVFLPNVEDR